MSESESIEEALASLRHQISSCRQNSRGSRLYSRALRSSILTFAQERLASGSSVAEVSSLLGVGEQLLFRWLKGKRPSSSSIKAVKVVPTPSSTLTVWGPLGLRIEGSASEIAELLRSCWVF